MCEKKSREEQGLEYSGKAIQPNGPQMYKMCMCEWNPYLDDFHRKVNVNVPVPNKLLWTCSIECTLYLYRIK